MSKYTITKLKRLGFSTAVDKLLDVLGMAPHHPQKPNNWRTKLKRRRRIAAQSRAINRRRRR